MNHHPHETNPLPKQANSQQTQQSQSQQPPIAPLPDPDTAAAQNGVADLNTTIPENTNAPLSMTPLGRFHAAYPPLDDFEWTLYHSGLLFEFKGKPKQTLACWEKFEEENPGHAPTRFELAMAYIRGAPVFSSPKNDTSSKNVLKFLQLAAAQGHEEAAAYLALIRLAGLHFPLNSSALTARSILENCAAAGSAAAMYWLSAIHLHGIKSVLQISGLAIFLPQYAITDGLNAILNLDNVQFAQSNQHAQELLLKSAQLGYGRAQSDVASNHLLGEDAEISLDQAVHWATQFERSNHFEQFTCDKAHGWNAEMDEAWDCIHGTNGRTVDYDEAEKLLVSASEKGYAKAHDLHGLLGRLGKIPSNQHLQLLTTVLSAVRGSPEGQCRLGYEYVTYDNFEAAAHWLQLAADQNHLQAIDGLACMYEKGFHFEKDVDKAVELASKAAHGGYVRAQVRMAHYYWDGCGVEKSDSGIAEWYTKIINTPVSPDGTNDFTKLLDPDQTERFRDYVNSAHLWLGRKHLEGKHFPQNFSKGLQHLTLGAEGGSVDCQSELGHNLNTYVGGGALPESMQDNTAAAKWYTMAAHQNDAFSQHCLGVLLRDGRGVEQDVVAAAEWFRKAVDNGSSEAACDLGKLYFHGAHAPLVPKNVKEGLRLITSAAKQGELPAQSELAHFLKRTGKDNRRAEKWYTAAVKQGGSQEYFDLAMFYIQRPEYLPSEKTEAQVDAKIINLLSKAAQRGHLLAKYQLGTLYNTGFRSIERDYSKTVRYLTACLDDDPNVRVAPSIAALQASLYLGVICESFEMQIPPIAPMKTSLGFTTSLEWHTFGATHGHALSQCRLAEIYTEGTISVDQDDAQASYWLGRALDQDNPYALELLDKMQHGDVIASPPPDNAQAE